jgi:hypothetical protein
MGLLQRNEVNKKLSVSMEFTNLIQFTLLLGTTIFAESTGEVLTAIAALLEVSMKFTNFNNRSLNLFIEAVKVTIFTAGNIKYISCFLIFFNRRLALLTT